ncbi:MAG: hypothetical protein H7124_05560 [Phycisphaerales bacterium]|nr:hypothetical protein [Hyphomonadaceae bacterium]
MNKRLPYAPILATLAALPVLAPQGAWAQLATGSGVPELPLLRLVLGFVLCAMVALMAALALKRFMNGGLKLPTGLAKGLLAGPAREVLVHETHRISATAEVSRLGWGGQQFLIVITNSAISVLDTRANPPDEPSP